MVNDFILSRIDTAHALIDEQQYEEAVGILKNLKLRIHDPDIEKRIKEFEDSHDRKLHEMLFSIENSNNDPLLKQRDAMNQLKKYAESYLKYYDGLIKKENIF